MSNPQRRYELQITISNNLGEEQAPLRQYMPIHICLYFFLGLGQQLTNLTAAASCLIKGDLFL